MTSKRLPMLDEDGDRFDWPQAHYQPKIARHGNRATVKHDINGAPELERLVRNGTARWVTELRCPTTLLSRRYRSSSSEQTLTWHEEHLSGSAFLIPGLVAAHDLKLRSRNLNSFVWPKGAVVDVPAGWWLARGNVRSTTALSAALVGFRRDKKLRKGRMRVDENPGGEPHFWVHLAEDLHKRCKERDIQIAGLIAAFGMLPRSSWSDEDDTDCRAASQLRGLLDHENIPAWNDPDFDPALAATAVEAFTAPPNNPE